MNPSRAVSVTSIPPIFLLRNSVVTRVAAFASEHLDEDHMHVYAYIIPMNPEQFKKRKLFIAIKQGVINLVRSLGQEVGININDTNSSGATPLYIAAQEGHIEIVRCLVKELGADVNKTDDFGITPLYIAAQKGHIEVVRCLVSELGADRNKAIDNGATPLYAAVYHGHVDVVSCLIKELGVEVNQVMRDGITPLYIAAQQGHIEVMRFLVKELGMDVNQAIDNGATALYIAAHQGYIAIVECLIREFGANVNQSKRNGATPLYTAVLRDHIEICRLLVVYGATTDDHCLSQINHAEHPITGSWLLRVYKANWPLLHHACEARFPNRVQELLYAGSSERALAYDLQLGKNVSAQDLSEKESPVYALMEKALLPYGENIDRFPPPFYPSSCNKLALQLLLVNNRLNQKIVSQRLPGLPQDTVLHILKFLIDRSEGTRLKELGFR